MEELTWENPTINGVFNSEKFTERRFLAAQINYTFWESVTWLETSPRL